MKNLFYFLTFFVSIVLISLKFPSISFAAEYFVSADGSDNANGSSLTPWRTIQKGVNSMTAGDTLNVMTGTYSSFTVSKSGLSGKPITIQSFNDQKPKIEGGIGIRITNSSYIVIRGFEVTGASGNGVQRMGGVVIIGGGNNTIDSCVIHDNVIDSPNGIKIENSSNNLIINNDIYGNGGANGGVGIRIIGSSSSPMSVNNKISNNKIHNNVLAGSNADGIGLIDNVGYTDIFNNTVYANGDDGIDTWNTRNNQIIKNVVYDHKGPGDGNGYKMGGSSTGGSNVIKQNIAYNNKLNGFDSNGSGGNKYYNNLAYNNSNFGFEDGWKDSGCTITSCQTTYVNNIGYNNKKGNLSASDYTALSHNNLWYSDSGTPAVFYKYNAYSSLDAFYKASGNRLDNPNSGDLSSFTLNPQFISPTNYDFDLKSVSPAIDRGDVSNPAQIESIGRVDIGAIEYIGTNTQPTPTATPIVIGKPGDLDKDGDVDIFDYNKVVNYFGNPYTIFDYNNVVGNFGK